MAEKDKVISQLNNNIKQDNDCRLLPVCRCICDAFSNVTKITPQKYTFTIPEEIGRGGFRQISTRKNIIISEFQMCYKYNIDVMGTNDTSNIDICFCLGEGVAWESQDEPKQLEINKGETFISNNRHGVERTCYRKDCDFNFIGIKIPIIQFRKIIAQYVNVPEEIAIEKSVGRFAKYSMTPSVRIILQQLLNCPYQNAMLDMYTEGKLLELLSVYISEVILQRGVKQDAAVDLSKTDRGSLYKAREILDENIASPPSCVCLSRMVFLSESKLTKGFKALFGKPVHNYVIDKRLETALLLFEKGQFNVSNVAGAVGYGNISHFAAAFKKKYGVNPGEFVKSLVNK